MECAGKGQGKICTGPPTRRCARCGAVAYCSLSHQISHWNEHKEECERLEEQMNRVDVLNDFPFTFAQEATDRGETSCSFLKKRSLHRLGMWRCECACGEFVDSFDHSRLDDGWYLSRILCPCTCPKTPLTKCLSSWKKYYKWRCIPVHSPVSLLLHWPLTIYHATKLAITNLAFTINEDLCIHYLGIFSSLTLQRPEKELLQLPVFGELCALFPGVRVHIKLIGPAIPQERDGEIINFSSYAPCIDSDCTCKSLNENVIGVNSEKSSILTLQLHRGFYHDRHRDIVKDSFPDLVIGPNAGIAAYPSWLPTIELIKEMNVPAVFTDYCEEAAHLAARCICSVTGSSLKLPIQLNPFRQPMVVRDSALLLPCYSNCFLFGI